MATQGYQREDSRDRTNKNMLNLNFQLSQPSPYPNIKWAKKNQHQSVESNNLLFKARTCFLPHQNHMTT